MTDPVRRQWSEEELRVAPMEFMRLSYGWPEQTDKRAQRRYCERLGLIVTFTARMCDTYAPSQADDIASG